MKKFLKILIIALSLTFPITIVCRIYAAESSKPEYGIQEVDGIIDWENVPELAIDQVLWTPDVGIKATGQICYDTENMYIHLSTVEKDIRAENTEPMSPVYEDSCLEFFFMLPEEDNYFNFEVNPNGCLNIQFGPEKTDRVFLVREDGEEYFDIHTDRTADGWEVFYRVPLNFIRLFYPGYNWEGDILANVYKCGNKTIHKHYLSWAPVHSEKPNFHQPDDFGIMYFE